MSGGFCFLRSEGSFKKQNYQKIRKKLLSKIDFLK
jgi:hypothetical protein